MSGNYDAGLLNDYGGGDVGWWHDYLRAEIERANEYHNEEIDRLYEALNLAKTAIEQDRTAFHHISDTLSGVRSRNTALLRNVGELVEENSRLRLALANAQHGDV